MTGPTYKIVIVGAGPVGLAVGALLAASRACERLQISIIDAGTAPHWEAEQLDLRVYALSRASQQVLDAAGAWRAIAGQRMSPYRRMQIWEGATWRHSGKLQFDSVAVGEPDLGAIVEDSLIRSELSKVLEANPRIEIRRSTTVADVQVRGGCIELLTASTEQAVIANLLVAADGAQSAVRKRMDFKALERDYQQQAIVAHIESEAKHAATAWPRFLPGGPLAFLPLADGRSSIVWSLPNAEAAALMETDAPQFERALGYASGGVLGALRLSSRRVSLPLRAQHALSYCQPRVALAGDAAHTVHPLAGQGMNLGLQDAWSLAQAIEAAVLSGQDPGDLRVLRRYERARKAENLAMLTAFDGIDRLFRAPRALAPLRLGGLNFVDRLPLLKRQLILRALGLSSQAGRKRSDRWSKYGTLA